MAPTNSPGVPSEGNKPQPLGNFPLVLLFTFCTLCILFLLWRQANNLRRVVSHQLKTWSRQEGAIRLSQDDGPSAAEFLEDDYDEDVGSIDEPLVPKPGQHPMARRETERELPPIPSE
ncbi:hypothetical protein SERLA73DRAFT_187901 [Serpula lacrymans var. lacrymans S7.3]|uniref:Uncharacterized protein n=2 Tax=Serpula lacrymans var. lacrymans TaxID=341189 RepID=F8QAP3_SERL3|nr:uncharacterized protein SERLADRAFT_477797 [Serpula lacrymans var. lacrymans S7.9]EGN94833.1 hypothetical protein SERLA73DRAFT_187901 [Serpula lacrymans var. lacrymans S7.3]EGO20334.1 hypothetical protein SERLADRAFT_477797 [Serpula lacrymans var. lacrymans S7.9]